jgi:hypothetical protein
MPKVSHKNRSECSQFSIRDAYRIYVRCVTRSGAGIAQWYRAGLRAGWLEVRVPVGSANLSPQRPDRLWGTPSLLSNGSQGLFRWGGSGRGVKLIPHLHLVPRSRMCGVIPPLHQYAFMTWCSVKAQGQLYQSVTRSRHIPFHVSMNSIRHSQ